MCVGQALSQFNDYPMTYFQSKEMIVAKEMFDAALSSDEEITADPDLCRSWSEVTPQQMKSKCGGGTPVVLQDAFSQ